MLAEPSLISWLSMLVLPTDRLLGLLHRPLPLLPELKITNKWHKVVKIKQKKMRPRLTLFHGHDSGQIDDDEDGFGVYDDGDGSLCGRDDGDSTSDGGVDAEAWGVVGAHARPLGIDRPLRGISRLLLAVIAWVLLGLRRKCVGRCMRTAGVLSGIRRRVGRRLPEWVWQLSSMQSGVGRALVR